MSSHRVNSGLRRVSSASSAASALSPASVATGRLATMAAAASTVVFGSGEDCARIQALLASALLSG